MNDEQLNKLLRESRPEIELPASFQRGVWQRISVIQARHDSRWGWLNDLLLWIARPVPAAVTCTAALAFGLVLGSLQTPASSPESRAHAYADSINPLAQVARP